MRGEGWGRLIAAGQQCVVKHKQDNRLSYQDKVQKQVIKSAWLPGQFLITQNTIHTAAEYATHIKAHILKQILRLKIVKIPNCNKMYFICLRM